MRARATNGPLSVQAISGTHVVSLGFDHDRDAMEGVLGFAIERIDHTEGEQRWLDNRIRFPQARDRWGSNWHPFQTFAWGDYRAKPGHVYTYRVHTMVGEPGEELEPASSASVQVRTEEPGVHGVWFNRAALSSQAYVERFGGAHPKDVPRREAWRWLSRGLEEALLAFIGQAIDQRWTLRGAFYEFRYAPVLHALRIAAEAGAEVDLVVYDHKENHEAAADAGIEKLVRTWRAKAKIPHNKFLVASRDGEPDSVWTGSTNLTENGVFGQSNVGHVVTDPAVAAQYLSYWEQLLDDPSPGTLNDWVDANNPFPDPWPQGTAVVFSPHTQATAQDRYAALFGEAQQLVCITLPFNLDQRFVDQLPEEQDALRWLLFESEREADEHRDLVQDPDTELVAGSIVEEGGLKGWKAEHKNPFSRNIEYLHTKYLLVDPLGDDPIVVTGSANFSNPSAKSNDENMLVIRGDTRVADIYFTEFFRLFNHYRFRDRLRLRGTDPTPGPETGIEPNASLAEASDWWDRYYDEPARAKQRQILAGTAP